MEKRDKDTIILGSGNLYYTEFKNEIPEVEEICKKENLAARISGGCSIEYKPSFYTAQDDTGIAQKTVITAEEATLKTGIITRIGKNLDKMSSTARVTKKNGRRTVKIGGVGNYEAKYYLWCFHHIDKLDGDIWVIVVGQNQAGFTLAFTKEKETIVDLEIKAEPQDEEGTQITYIEECGEDDDEASTQSDDGESAP